MKRVIKPAGVGRIELEEVPIPPVGPGDVLIRTHVTLISAGSELGGRYLKEEHVDPAVMGYLATGEVVETGPDTPGFEVGDRVFVTAPHAEYVVGNVNASVRGAVKHLPPGVSYEDGAFIGLATSAYRWVRSARVQPHETVVILGQGLVGSLILQTLVGMGRPRRVIAVDGYELRCDLAATLGADEVLNFRTIDVTAAVKELTQGRGADLVIDAVGGKAGLKSFETAQTLVRTGGRLILVGLYHGANLSVSSGFLATRQLLGANFESETWVPEDRDRAAANVAGGVIRPQLMITHRFPYHRAKEAFDLLYERPHEAMCVLLQWPPVLDTSSETPRDDQ